MVAAGTLRRVRSRACGSPDRDRGRDRGHERRLAGCASASLAARWSRSMVAADAADAYGMRRRKAKFSNRSPLSLRRALPGTGASTRLRYMWTARFMPMLPTSAVGMSGSSWELQPSTTGAVGFACFFGSVGEDVEGITIDATAH